MCEREAMTAGDDGGESRDERKIKRKRGEWQHVEM